MSKGIEFKAYHLSELAKENPGDSDEIEYLLEKVEKFKELDVNKNLDQLSGSLTELIARKLLDSPLFAIRNYASQEENILFIKQLLDLSPVLLNFTTLAVGKIDQELSEKLDETITKVKGKPGLTSRDKSNSYIKKENGIDEKQVIENMQKKGTFSKMLTHLTKSRPKTNRPKRNDKVSDHAEESQNLDKNEDFTSTENVGPSNDQLNLENSQKDLESISPAAANWANIMKQGNNLGENESSIQNYPTNSASPDKKSSPQDQVLNEKPNKSPIESVKPIGLLAAETSPGKVLESENLELTPSKPKVGPRPPKSHKLEDAVMVGAEPGIDTHMNPVSARGSIPKQTERPKSAVIVANNMSPVEVTRPLSMMDETLDSNHISLKDFEVGQKAPSIPNGNSTEIIPGPKIAPKPTPPKRPVRHIVSDAQNDAVVQPFSNLKVGNIDTSSNERPKSEVITCTVVTSPIEAKRTLSVTDETLFKEEAPLENISQDATATSPKRIPGVFASNHGAIGALAAAVTGRRNNFRSSHTESEAPVTSASKNAALNTTETVEVADDNDGVENSAIASNEEKERSHTQNGPTKSHSFISNTPLTFKKKDTSLSGDDKGIEKSALDWLNDHLSSKNIHIENLYDSLGDGLNLIYALEDATKESVGKYNKKTMLPVHKIDNLSVVLNFLAKKGVDIQFITPQDIMDGNKGKLLTLFVGILKL